MAILLDCELSELQFPLLKSPDSMPSTRSSPTNLPDAEGSNDFLLQLAYVLSYVHALRLLINESQFNVYDTYDT